MATMKENEEETKTILDQNNIPKTCSYPILPIILSFFWASDLTSLSMTNTGLNQIVTETVNTRFNLTMQLNAMTPGQKDAHATLINSLDADTPPPNIEDLPLLCGTSEEQEAWKSDSESPQGKC